MCMANAMNVAAYANKFPQGCWSFLGLGCEKKWYGTHVSKPNGEWKKTAEVIMLNFGESGHPVVRATSALERRKLKKQREWEEVYSLQRKWRNRWVDSSHCYFCQSAQYLGSSRRLVQRIRSSFKKSNWRWDLWIFGAEIPNANAISQSSTSLAQEDLLQEYEWKFAELSDDQKLSKLCSDAEQQFFIQLKRYRRLYREHVENTHNLEIWKHPGREGGLVRIRKSAQCWMWTSILTKDVIVLISWLNPCFKTKQFHGSARHFNNLTTLGEKCRNWWS